MAGSNPDKFHCTAVDRTKGKNTLCGLVFLPDDEYHINLKDFVNWENVKERFHPMTYLCYECLNHPDLPLLVLKSLK